MEPKLRITKDTITIDTKTALRGEDVLHLTNASATDRQTGQDLTDKLLVNMADVHLGQAGTYQAAISLLDENGGLKTLRKITININASNTSDTSEQEDMTEKAPEPKSVQKSRESKVPLSQTSKPSKNKKGWVKKIIYLVLALLAVYLIWTGISYYHTRQQLADQGNQITELQRKNNSLGDELDTANTQLKELRQNYKQLKTAVNGYQKDEAGYRQQYLNQMRQVSQSLAGLKQQLDNQTQQTGILYNILNGRLNNLQTTVDRLQNVQSADQAQQVLDNYKWYK